MSSLENLLTKNTLVQHLLAEGEISLARLKKIYRRLCKLTHPDLQQGSSQDFIQLREEYEEAKANLESLAHHFTASHLKPSSHEFRKLFYEALRHYLAAGLSSARMRIRSQVKLRNQLILREVLNWAKLYKPSFIEPFVQYNRIYLRRFTDWQRQDDLKKAQRLLLYAMYNTIDYVLTASPQALRAVRSYLADCLGYLRFSTKSMAGQAILALRAWFAAEIESLALGQNDPVQAQGLHPKTSPLKPEEDHESGDQL